MDRESDSDSEISRLTGESYIGGRLRRGKFNRREANGANQSRTTAHSLVHPFLR
jgi:hypothetical protein